MIGTQACIHTHVHRHTHTHFTVYQVLRVNTLCSMTCPMLQKMNRKLHLSKVKHSKFNESGQLLVFYLASVIWGADIILRVSAACKTSIQNFLLAKSSSSNGPILKQSAVYCSAVCALRWFCRSHCSASAGLIVKQSAGFYSASDSIHVPYTTFAILGALPLQVWFWNSLQVIIPQVTVCAFLRFCHSRCSAFAGLILKQSTGYYSASDSMRLTPLLPFSVLCLYVMRSKYITQIQQQRPELPTVTLTGMRTISINTRCINSTRYSQPHLACVYCTSGGVYVPCVYMHARWE